MHNLIRADQLDRNNIDYLLQDAWGIEHHAWDETLKNKIMATLFFEPSTRTRLSFETAMLRMGGKCISVADGNSSSTSKGESIEDTIMTVSQYADVIVIRHPTPGVLNSCALWSKVPVINAGDGDNEHPTQAILDLYTIKQKLGTLSGLKIMISGDLKHSRTTKSILRMLLHYDAKIYLHHPEGLGLDTVDCRLDITIDSDRSTLKDMDVLYMVRPQKERWHGAVDPKPWTLTWDDMQSMKDKSCILHPLPRNDELPRELDKDPRVTIWDQVRNGVFVRMALLRWMLNSR